MAATTFLTDLQRMFYPPLLTESVGMNVRSLYANNGNSCGTGRISHSGPSCESCLQVMIDGSVLFLCMDHLEIFDVVDMVLSYGAYESTNLCFWYVGFHCTAL